MAAAHPLGPARYLGLPLGSEPGHRFLRGDCVDDHTPFLVGKLGGEGNYLADGMHMKKTPTLGGFSGEAPGIEADQRQPPDPIEHQDSLIGVRAISAYVPDRASKCAIERREVTESSEAYELSNVVETALAKALVLAAEAKRWDVVSQLATELERRSRGASVDGEPHRLHRAR